MRCFYLICLLLTYSISHGGSPETVVTIQGKGTRGPYLLGYRNILLTSVNIYKGTDRFPDDQYTVHNVPGILFFQNPIPLDDTITVAFNYIPLSLQTRYSLHAPVDAKLEPAILSKPSGQKPSFDSSDLSVKGSKGFSIETGYGAGGMSQSLNLSITGDIVRGLRTSAHISDKSATSGGTRRIEEIDRIYIEAESENFKGTFGDFEITEGRSGFANFNRKLTGLDLNYKDKRYSVKGAAAFFPGEYASMTITGVDGRLGPYYLRDIGGREGTAILAGSERVYIDGISQKRGSENDYTIDYDAGALEFAPSKIINDRTRITVEYEIIREEYSRSFYSGGGRAEIVPRLRFYGNIIQEGDRGNSPKSFELTSENRLIVEQAGDNRLNASRDGAEYVGDGNGDYTRIDSAGIYYYSYAGAGSGGYKISFSFIGVNEGSYRFSGGGIYEYVGPGAGGYEPIILLPLPRLKRYGVLGSSYADEDSAVIVNAELFGSILDRNTLSEIDTSSRGLAGDLAAGYKYRFADGPAFAGVRGRLRRIGTDVIFPGKIDAVERYRDYDLVPESDLSGEILREAGIESGLDDGRRMNLDFGYLERPGIEDRKRYSGDLRWRLPASIDWFGRLERTESERIWRKRSTGLSFTKGWIRPAFGINYERRDGDSGFKFYEYYSALPAEYAKGINGNTELSYRDEKYLDGFWRDKFRSGSVKQKLEFVSAGSGVSGELSGAYFRKEYQDLSGPDVEQKSGSTRINYNNPDGKGEFYLNERLSSSNERLRSKTYIYAGEGEGRYRYEDGLYIEDPDGDYVLLIEELGEGKRITEIATEINGSTSPLNIIDPGKQIESRIGRMVLETELTYKIKKSTDVLTGRDFYPWRNDSQQNTLLTNGRADIRLYYYPAGSKHRWKYSLSRSYQDGNPFANETVSERFKSDDISWAFPVGSAVNVVLSGSISESENILNSVGYSVDRHRETAKIDYSLTEIWTLETGLGFEEAGQSANGLKARIPSGELRIIGDLKGRGRASANAAYYRVSVNPEGSYIPYQVAGGKKEGDNFTGGIQARMELYRNGRLDMMYRFEKFATRPERHNLKIEFTMLFQ